ncbi:MAG TPA: zinc-binding alcohol dehydrogenase family protein [Lapillicoccus sp.]|nr:zinc-binding alcohol dehydrogenase family protein [Lapillicoccus sp.]
MRAALLESYGSPPVAGVREAPSGAGPLVSVTVAPIVPLDLFCASGSSYFGRLPLPYVPGVQGVGMLADTGTRVWFATSAGMAPGDGSLAEQCTVAADDLVPLPDRVADEDAAAIGLSGVAAWMCLTWRARLQPGERVLVLGAGGVVGQAAVAGARRLGASSVVAVCRSAAAEARARRAGADSVVVVAEPETTDVAALSERFVAAGGGPVDVVVDPVFGPSASAACLALAPGGRLVNLGGLSGDGAQLSSAVLRSRSASVLGYTNNAITPAQRAEALGEVLRMAADGDLVVDHRTHPLDDVATAWAAAARGDGVRSLVRLR